MFYMAGLWHMANGRAYHEATENPIIDVIDRQMRFLLYKLSQALCRCPDTSTRRAKSFNLQRYLVASTGESDVPWHPQLLSGELLGMDESDPRS